MARGSVILTLCCAIGLQWVALQSVAWTIMIFEYARETTSLSQAVAQTFDGNHPCSLCHAMQKAKSSEKKTEFVAGPPRIDLICPEQIIRFAPPVRPWDYPMLVTCVVERMHSPPVPPPRTLLG